MRKELPTGKIYVSRGSRVKMGCLEVHWRSPNGPLVSTHWGKIQRLAEEGDVFGPVEMYPVKAAVKQFGHSFGAQRPEKVAIVMGQIIKNFPGTPMSRVAQEQIERATVSAEHYSAP